MLYDIHVFTELTFIPHVVLKLFFKYDRCNNDQDKEVCIELLSTFLN